jgi:general secretion pathway protein D
MKKSKSAPVALLLLAASSLPFEGSQTVRAQTPAPNTQRITTNFKDADITTVAEAVAAATNRTFIVDPRVRAQVNLISGSPMTPEEFYQAFLSILQVHGFAAIPSGNVIKLIPDANARYLPSNDLVDRTGSGGGDEMVTQVITIRNANANQLVQVLKPLNAQYGHMASVPGSNTIVISDRASNVARIMRIIARVDQTGDANVEVIPLQNSTAADIVRTINALNGNQQQQEAAGIAPRIVADDRSNSVLISGEAAARLRVATLIAHLDTPLDDGGGTRVRYLRYADAENLEAKLKEQLSGIASPSGGGGAPGAATAAAGPAADRNATIWAEKETNALVITASPKTMRLLGTIIDQLDIPRAQVHLEAIIVEVSTNKSADLGVNWAVFSNEDGTNVPAGGFISPIGGTSIVNLAQSIADPANATAPNGATFGIGRLRDSGINFAAMIRALRTDDNTNVIATPSTTTLDNQEAALEVAQEVPFITGQYTTNSGTGGSTGQPTPFTTIQREKVGTILKITPKINDGTAVVMKVELESSELSSQRGDANSLITNTRTFNTTVMIEDGGIIVLGGLIRDSSIRGETRVPFLGRIPLIGEAFKTRSGRRDKSNLMVFIRPRILRDGIATANETNRKYNAIRQEQIQQGPRNELIPLLPFENRPELPPPPPVPESVAPLPTGPEEAPATPERTP